MSTRNRLSNCHNRFQGQAKRVLTVCSAGLLRSPTAAWVLSNDPWNFNTRACGYNSEYALVVLDEVLLEWADEVVVMDETQRVAVLSIMNDKKPVHMIDVPDNFDFRDPDLVEIMVENFREIWPVDR